MTEPADAPPQKAAVREGREGGWEAGRQDGREGGREEGEAGEREGEGGRERGREGGGAEARKTKRSCVIDVNATIQLISNRQYISRVLSLRVAFVLLAIANIQLVSVSFHFVFKSFPATRTL